MEGVVVDTNVFVAAGFNPSTASARLLDGIREERFRLILDQPTRRETEMILRRIPRLDWRIAADLFRPEGEFRGRLIRVPSPRSPIPTTGNSRRWPQRRRRRW